MFTLTKIYKRQLLLLLFLSRHKAIVFDCAEANPCKALQMTVIYAAFRCEMNGIPHQLVSQNVRVVTFALLFGRRKPKAKIEREKNNSVQLLIARIIFIWMNRTSVDLHTKFYSRVSGTAASRSFTQGSDWCRRDGPLQHSHTHARTHKIWHQPSFTLSFTACKCVENEVYVQGDGVPRTTCFYLTRRLCVILSVEMI